MANFDDIDEARKLLGLGEAATLKEVRSAYRRMASHYHPDKHTAGDSSEYEETMKRLNWAYKVLSEYCRDYKYTFRKEDVARTYPHDEYLRRYYHGWFDGI
jgi:DnaJ-class molecular chaperone